MTFDINQARFSGEIMELKDLPTRTGTKMVSLKIRCWREQIRVVAFKEYAEIIMDNFRIGDRIEIAGRLQTSTWEHDGTRYNSFQVNVNEIVGHQVDEEEQVRLGQENVDYAGGPF